MQGTTGNFFTECTVNQLLALDGGKPGKTLTDRRDLEVTAFPLDMKVTVVDALFQERFYVFGLHDDSKIP